MDPESTVKSNVSLRLKTYLDMLKASSNRFEIPEESNKIISDIAKLSELIGDKFSQRVESLKEEFSILLGDFITENREMFEQPLSSNDNLIQTRDLLIRTIQTACLFAKNEDLRSNRILFLHLIYENIVKKMEDYRLPCKAKEVASLVQMSIRGMLSSTMFEIMYNEDGNFSMCPRCRSESLVSGADAHTFRDMPDAWCGVCLTYYIKNKYGELEKISTPVEHGMNVYDIKGKNQSTVLSTKSRFS